LGGGSEEAVVCFGKVEIMRIDVVGMRLFLRAE
jgi:hypothetical protein